MKPPLFRELRQQDYSSTEDLVSGLVISFNNLQQELIDCLTKGINSDNLARTVRSGVNFRTDSSGNASCQVVHDLPTAPILVSVGRLSQKYGAPLGSTVAWSSSWVSQGKQVSVSFVGLPASVELVATVVIE